MAMTPEEIAALEEAIRNLRSEVSALGAEGASRAVELDILEDALTRGGEAAVGVASAVARIRREMAETSDASRTLARGTERLIRTLTGVERTADGVVAGFARMIAEGEGLSAAIGTIAKEVAETVSPTNAMIATFKKFAEGSSVLTLSIDNATSAFARSTGTGLKYKDVIRTVEFQNRDLGVTADQAATAVGALQSGFSEFLMMSEKAQKDLAVTVAQFETFGVSADNTTGFLQAVTRTTGRTSTGALKLQKSIMGTAKAFGDDLNKVMQEASTIMPKLAIHGQNMEKVFDDLYSASKRTGMAMQDIVSLSEQFDTFDSAADAAGNLNAVLASMGGTPLVDTMEILETTNPAERMELFRNAISQSVGDFESLDYWSQKALSNTLGMSSEQLLMMMNQEEQVDALEAAMTKAGLRQKDMVELQKAGRDFAMEAKILALSFAVSLQKPLSYLKDTMSEISAFLMDISKLFPGSSGGLIKIGGALGVAAGMGALTTIISAMVMRGTRFVPDHTSDSITHGLLARLVAAETGEGVAELLNPSRGMGSALKNIALPLAGLAVAVAGVGHAIKTVNKEEDEEKKKRRMIGAGVAGAAGTGLGVWGGMAAGGLAGSVVPGVGTVVGGITGGLLGLGLGSMAGSHIGGLQEGGITQGLSIAGEAGPEAVVPLPDGRTIPVTLNTAAFEPLINKLDEVASRITDAVDRNQAVLLQSDLESAGFRRGRRLALDSR
jgi:hypothetical protein